jgi:hypothetical protein
MTRARCPLLAAAYVAIFATDLGCGSDDESYVDVVVSEQPPGLPLRIELLTLTVTVIPTDGLERTVREESLDAVYVAGPAGGLEPWSVRVEPVSGSDVGRTRYRARAIGLREGHAYVTTQASFRFTSAPQMIPLRLDAACIGIPCGAEMTCVGGVCVPDLQPVPGSPPIPVPTPTPTHASATSATWIAMSSPAASRR